METKKRLSVLFIPSGTRCAPATRYRVYQYLPYLEREGVDYKIYSIISEGLTRQMINSPAFGRFRRMIYYLRVITEKFIRGCVVILMADRFDLVFLQRTTFPLGLERALGVRNKNIIFDIDDSIYMPDREEGGIIGRVKRYIKRKEVVSVLGISECVIVENEHIKNFVARYCNKIHLITGPIDTVRNYAKGHTPHADEVTIGWIGSPSTTPYLSIIDSALQELNNRYRIKVRLIGASFYSIGGVRVELVDWREETEVSELHKFDIGIMPMPDNEWTRGKVGCKMLQYMANAIPAVVSYTPTNAEIIEDGIDGFLANSKGEWFSKLSLLIENPSLREKIGLAGRETVEKRFSLKVNPPIFLEILKTRSRG